MNLKEMQAEMLSMLCDVDALFKKNDIPYMLLGGSVLGAIRHNGFIPWDDDVDIGILRCHFEKAENLLASMDKYVYEYAEKHIVPDGPCAHLHSTKGVLKIKESPTLDFFPIDTVPSLNDKRELRKFMFLANVHHLAVLRKAPKNHGLFAKMALGFVVLITPNFIFDKIQKYTLKKILSKHYEEKWLGNIWQGTTEFFPEKMYLESTTHVFEGHEFPIPKDYEGYLTALYGDWRQLPPENERNPKHMQMPV